MSDAVTMERNQRDEMDLLKPGCLPVEEGASRCRSGIIREPPVSAGGGSSDGGSGGRPPAKSPLIIDPKWL